MIEVFEVNSQHISFDDSAHAGVYTVLHIEFEEFMCLMILLSMMELPKH